MDDALKEVLEELARYGSEHDAAKADRLERLRNLEPQSASLLALLVRATHATRVLELGTSNGYSTLWLADAVRSCAGGMISVDVDAARSAAAAGNLERAGLRGYVELRVEDAANSLRNASDAGFDMVFLDAERSAYTGYWPELMRVLRPGGLLVVDNVLSHAEEVGEFRALVAAEERVSEAIAPTGAGLMLIVREAAAPA